MKLTILTLLALIATLGLITMNVQVEADDGGPLACHECDDVFDRCMGRVESIYNDCLDIGQLPTWKCDQLHQQDLDTCNSFADDCERTCIECENGDLGPE